MIRRKDMAAALETYRESLRAKLDDAMDKAVLAATSRASPRAAVDLEDLVNAGITHRCIERVVEEWRTAGWTVVVEKNQAVFVELI